MPGTTIDELVVTLGLNTLGFKKGQNDISRAVKDTSQTIKSATEDMSASFVKVGLAFSGIFLGIRGIEDVIHGFRNLSGELWQLGINSKNLGIATNELRNWQEVAQLAGGKAEDATAAVNGLQSALFNLKYRGQPSEQIEGLLRLGINPLKYGNTKEDFNDLMLQVAGQLEKKFSDQGTRYQYATNYLQLTGGVATAVAGGTAKLREFLATAAKAPQLTKKQTDEQAKLNDSMVSLRYNISGASAEILDNLTPALEGLTGAVNGLTAPLHFISDLFDGKGNAGLFTQKSRYAIDTAPGSKLANIGDHLGKWWHGLLSPALEKRERQRFSDLFARTEKQYGLPAGTLDRIATQESHYDQSAVSPKGAKGIFQLMPQYFPNAGKNAADDTRMAAPYLASLHRQFGGDAGDPDWSKAFAAYNAGPGRVQRVLDGKSQLPTETCNYLDHVISPVNGATQGGAAASSQLPAINRPPFPTSSTAQPTSQIQIDSITVNTQATDANRIAADMARAVERKFTAAKSDLGLA